MTKTIDERVAEAAAELLAKDQNVTVAAVRQALGGGSLRDVGPALRKWKAQHKSSPVSAPIPPELAAVVERAAITIWSTAHARSEELFTLLRNQHAEQLQEVEAERDEAIEELARLQLELEATEQKLELTNLAAAESNLLAERAQAILSAVTNENEHLRASLAAQQQLLERAQESEKSALDQAAEYRGRASALDEQVRRLERPDKTP